MKKELIAIAGASALSAPYALDLKEHYTVSAVNSSAKFPTPGKRRKFRSKRGGKK